MRLLLTALSEPSIPPIAINDVLLPIGANEAAFGDLPADYRDQLDERHARIFEDQGVVYVVDLGSQSGTTLNGESVGSVPVAVLDGDVLQFGESLDYQVEFQPEDQAEASQGPDVRSSEPDVHLLLTATEAHQGMEPLAIERFPFLIGKNQPALGAWSERQPQAYRFLSRQHAQISHDGQAFRIEDLASTNGTWINGVRERATTRVLQDGDTVAFGQEGVSFRVAIREGVEPPALPEGTILVSTAESFLDIYCQSGPASAASQEREDGSSDQAPGDRGHTGSAKSQYLNPVRLPRPLQVGVAGALVGVIALVFFLFAGDDRREQILELAAQDNANEVMVLAQSYLVSHPDDVEIQQALDRAVKAAFIPAWLEAFGAQDWDRTDQLMEQARKAKPVASSFDWTKPLAWMADAEQFRRHTQDLQRYRLYRDEDQLALLASVDRHPASPPTPEIQMLIRDFPGLSPVYRESLSTLRRLKDHAGTYLPAIDDLNDSVGDALRAERAAAVVDELDDFADRYPDIDAGVLRRDIEQLVALTAAMAAGDLGSFARLEPELSFQSPVVRHHVQERLASLEQARRSAGVWREAQSSWRQGRTDAALDALSGLEAADWRNAVLAQRQQWEHDLAEYTELLGSVDADRLAPEGAARLGSLSARLDAEDDAWLYQRVAEMVQAESDTLRALAVTDLEQAILAWERYQEVRGGIDSNLRLEPEVSNRFRQQAGWLDEAYRHAEQASKLVAFLSPEQRSSAETMYESVNREITRQRLALDGLSSVLDPAVIDEKLALIPEP